MTDRIHALTIVLDSDIRDDDVQPIIAAIQMIKHVAAVKMHVTDWSDHVARQRVRSELAGEINRTFRIVLGVEEPRP